MQWALQDLFLIDFFEVQNVLAFVGKCATVSSKVVWRLLYHFGEYTKEVLLYLLTDLCGVLNESLSLY